MKIVIFAGGVGTRLWPLSRKHTPKQFEKIVGDKSTLQLTVQRVLKIVKPADIFISSGKIYKELLEKQLPQIPKNNFILEPQMRDVGAAVGLIAAIFEKIAPKQPFIMVWSDHVVKNEALFEKVLLIAEKLLEEDGNKIIFIGQKSRFASQNLGWIECGEKVRKLKGMPIFAFKKLHYRPTLDLANAFHKSTSHVWNPGYFGTTASFLFGLYKKYNPVMHKGLWDIQKAFGTKEFTQTLDYYYPELEKISFDNLILEKINPKDGLVIGADLGWSDVGAWESLKEALSKNKHDTVTQGKVLIIESKDSLVFNYTDQMIAGIDLENMLVINTSDVILICTKTSVPKIKKLVESLQGTPYENLT